MLQLLALCTAVIAISYAIDRLFLYRLFRSPIRHLPGPPLSSYIRGNMPEIFKAGPGVAHKEYVKEYGSVLRYHVFLGEERLCITDPLALNHILLSKSYDYPKPSQVRGNLSKILGKGILFAEGDAHRRQKRILSPAFAASNVAALAPTFIDKTSILRDIWVEELSKEENEQKQLDVQPWLSRCTLDIIGTAGLDYEFDALRNGKSPLALAFNGLFKQPFQAGYWKQILFVLVTIFPILQNIPTQRVREQKQALELMESEGYNIINKKKQQVMDEKDGSAKDLISLLMRANMASENEKVKMNDEELKGQGAQDRLRAELKKARSKAGGELDGETIGNLPYLDAVTREILRVVPPVPNTLRETTFDDVVPLSRPVTLTNGKSTDQLFVKAGTAFFIPIHLVNHSKEIWGEDAEQFRPERWLEPLDPKVIEQTKGYTIFSHLLTFLGGPRACIGYRFSVLELKCILAVLIDRFEFIQPDGQEIIGRSALVIRPFLKDNMEAGSQLPLIVKLAS